MHPTIKQIVNMMRFGVYMMIVPWLHCIINRLPSPGIDKPDEKFRELARKALEERRNVSTHNPFEIDAEPLLMFYCLSRGNPRTLML